MEGSVVIAQVAAALAWHSPAGLFSSPRLERLLDEIAGSLPPPPSRADHGPLVRDILHVLTTAYRVGGHTRLAWRWIERDDARRHSVALTRQGREALPGSLSGAVAASGGRLHRVDLGARKLTDRASVLAGLCAATDLVVLHLHPYDVVPSIALAMLERAGHRPPTLLLNHADHVFWVGLSCSDVVVHLRHSGARLSGTRRRLPSRRSAILPVPLGRPPVMADRAGARCSLGYADGDVVAVSIASGYKYDSPDQPGLLSILEEAMEQCPDLSVLAVGPGDRSDWQAAAGRWGGRFRAFGVLDDVAGILAAADIYLDSFPFSSLTSMLEAGQRSLPILAYGDPGADAEVLAFDDPATEGMAVREPTRAGYVAALRRLVDDPAARVERGRQVELALRACHEGRGWLDSLELAYAQAVTVRAAGIAGPASPVDDPPPQSCPELDRRLLLLLDGQQQDAPRGVRGHLRTAPLSLRLEEWRRSLGGDRPLSVFVLLPEGALMLARRASMLAHRIRPVRRTR